MKLCTFFHIPEQPVEAIAPGQCKNRTTRRGHYMEQNPAIQEYTDYLRRCFEPEGDTGYFEYLS